MFDISFFTEFLENFSNVISDVFNWFITPISIPIFDFSIAPIWAMFGSGLVALLGVVIVRFIK